VIKPNNLVRVLMAAAALAFNAPSVAAQETNENAASGRTTTLGSRDQQFLLAKIAVSDLRRSFDFYTKVIGLKWATSPSVPLDEPLGLNDPDPEFAEIPMNFTGSLADPFFVIVKKRASEPNPATAGLVWVGFKVPDVSDAIARARDTGAVVVNEVAAGPMKFGFIKDPDGYNIEFIQTARQTTSL